MCARLAERFGLDLGALRSDATVFWKADWWRPPKCATNVMPLSDLFVVDVREDGVIFQESRCSRLSRSPAETHVFGETAWCFTARTARHHF